MCVRTLGGLLVSWKRSKVLPGMTLFCRNSRKPAVNKPVIADEKRLRCANSSVYLVSRGLTRGLTRGLSRVSHVEDVVYLENMLLVRTVVRYTLIAGLEQARSSLFAGFLLSNHISGRIEQTTTTLG